MPSRLLRPLVHALVIAQVLLSAPVISATDGAASAGMPCHGDTASTTDHSHECPCCPDGGSSTAGCLAQCAGATASSSALVIPAGAERAERVEIRNAIENGDPTDPPLKPPPIL